MSKGEEQGLEFFLRDVKNIPSGLTLRYKNSYQVLGVPSRIKNNWLLQPGRKEENPFRYCVFDYKVMLNNLVNTALNSSKGITETRSLQNALQSLSHSALQNASLANFCTTLKQTSVN